jgi:hypothetical protein
MRKLVIGFASLAAIGAVACQTQGFCESTPVSFEYCSGNSTDPIPCQGSITNGVWESGPLGGNFLSWGAGQTIHMTFRDAQTGQVLSGEAFPIQVEVGAVVKPNVGGGSWIIGTDGLANLTQLDPTSLFVQNGTCSPYFVRVVASVVPPADAGSE